MDQQIPPPAAPVGPTRDLPPVTPPSGRFIAQLFLVPGMIVLVAVLLLLAFRYLVGSGYTPDSFLKQIDNTNADIRWRGASDLAQVLKRPESVHLKIDVGFALDLCERLRLALDDLKVEEDRIAASTAGLSQEARDKEWRKLNPWRNHVTFLAAALGDFHVAAGVPLLSEVLLRDDSPDIKGNTLRRRQAVIALANLGHNVRGYADLKPADRQSIAAALEKEVSAGNPQRALWARNAVYYLDKVKAGAASDGIVEMDKTLARAAKADDRFIRVQVALALNFWDGPLVEPTLQLLARDRGQGTLLKITELD